MFLDPFPECLQPSKLCNRNGTINSSIPLAELQRFNEYLHDNHGQVVVILSFSRDDTGNCLMQGNISSDINLLCQRCLEAVTIRLDAELIVRIADDEAEAEKIAETLADSIERLEILVCEDGKLDLQSVIEDELIMSLPIVASHDNDNCSKELNELQLQVEEIQDKRGSVEGLEALEKLKQELKQDK